MYAKIVEAPKEFEPKHLTITITDQWEWDQLQKYPKSSASADFIFKLRDAVSAALKELE